MLWEQVQNGMEKSSVENIDGFKIGVFGMPMGFFIQKADIDSVHEIGCIHTSQWLEFNYVGVISEEEISILFFIEHEVFDMIEIDIALEEHGLPCFIE